MLRTLASTTALAERTGVHSVVLMDRDVNTTISVRARRMLVGWTRSLNSQMRGQWRTAIAPITSHTAAGGSIRLGGS